MSSSRNLTLALLTVAIAACSATVPNDEARDEQVAGFDLDVDPALFGKADDINCRDYPGGALSGDDLLALVNKQPDGQLASDYAPRDLLAIPQDIMMPGRSGELRGPVLDALDELLEAAREDGVILGIRSAYRSFHTQCMTFQYKVRVHGLEHAKQFSAEPGRSQHQLGTAVDITSARLGWEIEQWMGTELEGQWLAEYAHQFGFVLAYPAGHEETTGYAYEPWHFRYIGLNAAAEMFDKGLILEDYLDRCQAGDEALTCERESFPEPVPNDRFIGGPCASDADCEGIGYGSFCELDGQPDGYCTMPCSLYCPDRDGALNSPTYCVAGDGASQGLCRSQCDTSVYPGNGCRQGYACSPGHRPSASTLVDVCLAE